MCIIAYGLKKDLKRSEVAECMKANGAGFFIAAIKPDKKISEPLRTMDRQKVFEYYDGADDKDRILLHARIPSCGSRVLGNVHGWEEEGIRFCHNGTMPSIAKWGDRTDSETFFRRIFMPCWRGEGRKFTDNVDFVVNHFAGSYNKFAFLLPDGEVKFYGNFIDDHGCKFSNETYKAPKPTAACTSSRQYGGVYGNAYGNAYDRYWGDEPSPVGKTVVPVRIKLDGTTLTDLADPDIYSILDFAVRHYLMCCQTLGRPAPLWVSDPTAREENMRGYAEDSMFMDFTCGPRAMVDDVRDLFKELKFPETYDADREDTMAKFLADYCKLVESWSISPMTATTIDRVTTALETVKSDVDAALDLMRITDLGVPVKKDLSERFIAPKVVIMNEGTSKAKAVMTRTKASELFRFTECVSDADTERLILPSFTRISNVAARTRLAKLTQKKGKK